MPIIIRPTIVLREVFGQNEAVILVVDDNADDYELVLMGLQKAGLTNRIQWCPSGAAGLLAVRDTAAPLVILLDIQMPVMSGPQFFDALVKQYPARRDNALVFILSTIQTDYSKRIFSGRNVDGVISKDHAEQFIEQLGEHWSLITKAREEDERENAALKALHDNLHDELLKRGGK